MPFGLNHHRPVLHVPADLYTRISVEGWAQFPLETGGIMLGTTTGDDAHVHAVIGAGPGAEHKRFGFAPDSEWQAAQVASAWERDKSLTYLGDWHTHPEGTTRFSALDEVAARQIAAYPAARQPNPYMLVIALSARGGTGAGAAHLIRDRLRDANVRVVPS